MSKLIIFIESKTSDNKPTNEHRFIKHLLTLLPEKPVDVEIKGVNGYTNLANYAETMQRNSALGGVNLVIFDADFSHTGGGFLLRKKELYRVKENMHAAFELFLFPNNKLDGTFEHILEELVTEMHKGILACFERYECCIRGYNNPNYESPDQKAKLYSYISVQKKTQKEVEAFKSGDWFFERTELWNFNAPFLNPLKEFLQNYTSVSE